MVHHHLHGRVSRVERTVRERVLQEQREWLQSLTDAELLAVVEDGDAEGTKLLKTATDEQLRNLITMADSLFLQGMP